MVDQKFLDELDHAFRHAKTICQFVFQHEDIDLIYITEDDDGSHSLKVEYKYNRDNQRGFGYGDYSGEFPIKYLTMTLDEIRVEEDRLREEERLKELSREAARKPQEIENITLNIKISQNSAEAYKKKYKALTGEDWKE